MDTDVDGDPLQRHPAGAITSHVNDVLAELLGIGLGHCGIHSAPLAEQGESAFTHPCTESSLAARSHT
jgi:hypothetical protein